MVNASPRAHLELLENANSPAHADVQLGAEDICDVPATKPIAGQKSPSHALVVAEPARPARKVSIIKAKRLARLHESAAVGLALGCLIAGYVAWRLSEGTVSIAAVTPFVEDALQRVVGGEATIGALRLGWDKQRRDFVVTANEISVTTDARTSPLALGQVNLTLNARALLAGRAQITRADIVGLQAVFVVDKQGKTAFGFGTPEEVLALPRQKRPSRSLRSVLDAVRTAVLPNNARGRVEAVILTSAQLVVIDPDTGERLTLSDARASVTTDSKNIVTMQAAGNAREMGGFANVAVSSSPDPTQRLVLAGVFDRAQLAKLPSSLRIGPLGRVGSDTAPFSGDVLVRLGEQARAFDVRANLALGAGRFQGIELQSASATLVWDGRVGNFSFQDVAARGPLTNVSQANGNISGLNNGLQSLTFDAKTFTYNHATIGAINADTVRGTAQLRDDNMPVSANVVGRSLTLVRHSLANITANGFGLVLSSPDVAQPGRMVAKLTAQNVSGDIEGSAVSGNQIDASLDGVRQGSTFLPSQFTLTAALFAAPIHIQNVRQVFNAKNLTLFSRQFQRQNSGRALLPNLLRFAASDIGLGGDGRSRVNGRVSDVALETANLWSGNGTAIGTIASFAADSTDGGGTGRAITFDIRQINGMSAQISRLQAQNLSLNVRQLSVGFVDLFASGRLSNSNFADGRVAAASVEIKEPTQLLRPFWAEDLRVRGSFAPRAIGLEAFAFRHRGVNLVGATTVALAPKGSARVDLNADVDGAFTVETLLSAWPRRFLPDTRGAITRLVSSGTATISRLQLAIPPGMSKKQILPKSGIDLDFALSEVSVTYLPGMSAITNVRGHGRLTGDSLFIDLPEGQIGNIRLSEGHVEIPQFMPSGARASVSAKIVGDVVDMAREIDLPPLAILTKARLDPERLSGRGNAALNLDIPLKPVLLAGDVGVHVRGDFLDAGLTRIFAGLDATQGAVHLDVVDNTTTIAGSADLAGNLFEFSWANTAPSGRRPQTQLLATGNVSMSSLSELGLDLDPYASGFARVHVDSNTEGSQFGAAILNADFIQTNIALPGNLWTKPVGVIAKGSANLYPREGGGWNVQDLKFDSVDTVLRGALDLSNNGELLDARFSRVVIPNAGDLSVNVTPAANGMIVTLRGDYLNLSPFLKTKNVSEQAVELFDRPLTLSADIKRVSTAEDSFLTNVHADIIRDLQGWRNLFATGESAAGKSQVRLVVERDGRRSISGVLSDAGFFAQLLYPGAPIFGGTGVIEGELPVVGANSSGMLSFTGRDILFDRAGASPILFDKVQLPMSVRGGVISLREGQADGAAYTVKANGYVDVGAGKLDLRGVATPGGLNRVLADIPLFGAILGGGTDEGLVGMTFTAKGSLSAPRLITNPISALAPGFLRKLFESNIPISPQPRLIVTNLAGDPIVTKWPYGPTENMSEVGEASPNTTKIGPTQ